MGPVSDDPNTIHPCRESRGLDTRQGSSVVNRENLIYGASGLLLGIVLTVLVSFVAMAGMMPGMARMMGMCPGRYSTRSSQDYWRTEQNQEDPAASEIRL